MFRYLPPNIHVTIFFSFLFSLYNLIACIITLILECSFFWTLLTGVKFRLQIQLNRKYTLLYFTKLNFFFETHLFHRGGGKLEHNPMYSSLSPCGVLERSLGFNSGSSLVFKQSSTQVATETPSGPVHVVPLTCWLIHVFRNTWSIIVFWVYLWMLSFQIPHIAISSRRYYHCSLLLVTAEVSVPTRPGLAHAVLFLPSRLRHISLVLRAWVQLYLLLLAKIFCLTCQFSNSLSSLGLLKNKQIN